jgi:hypothetical protein
MTRAEQLEAALMRLYGRVAVRLSRAGPQGRAELDPVREAIIDALGWRDDGTPGRLGEDGDQSPGNLLL